MGYTAIEVNQGTSAAIYTDNTGGTGGTQIGVVKLDISGQGTAGTLWGGNVGVSSGTINTLPNLPGGSIAVTAGTVAVTTNGTIASGSIAITAGTIASVGTIGTLGLGTVQMTSGTISVLPNLPQGSINVTAGTIASVGTIGTLGLGSVVVNTLPNLPQGSINVTAGTIATLGTMGTLGLVNTITTVSNLTNGSIHVTAGTEVITSGSISVIAGTIASDTIVGGTLNLGTVVGKDANAAAQTGNPIGIGGTDSGGTIRTVLVNSSGALSVTGASAGTFVNISTGTLGTIGNIGTLNSGSVVITSGTFNAGTITSGTINAGTFTVTLGTVVGKDANAAAQTANPISIGGTDSGGTVRTVLVNSAGAMSVSGASSGTFVNLSTGTLNTGTVVNNGGTVLVQGIDSGGTIHTVATDTAGVQQVNLGNVAIGTFGGQDGVANSLTSGFFFTPNFVYNGSTWDRLYGDKTNGAWVNMTAGTISKGTINTGTINLGTVVGKDANAVAQTGNPLSIGGTDSGGTVRTVLVNSSGAMSVTGASAGTFVNLSTGTLNAGTINAATITTGTINTGTFVMPSGTITVLPNLPQGSVNVTAGTVSAGTINVGTITVGTVYKGVPAPTAGSFTAAGSVVNVGSQSDITFYDLQGTWVGTVFFEGQIGTSAWFGVPAITPAGLVGTQTTGNGDYMVSMAGLDGARARLTYSSGTMNYNNRTSNFFAPMQYAMGGTIGNVGMVNSATITTLPNIPGGTINILAGGTIGILTNGTLSSSGTSTGVGTVTNLGSVTNLGQLYNAGTVQNQLAGTITALQFGTISSGTVNTGTINAGTINVATITAGTLSPIPTIANVTYGTHGTTGVSIFGTLAGGTGSGAGTEIFCTSVSFSIPSTGGSQDVSIGWGTNGGTFHAGTGLIVRGNFPPGGGIQKTYSPPINSGTNGQLCVFQAGAGTVDVSISYFLAVSSL